MATITRLLMLTSWFYGSEFSETGGGSGLTHSFDSRLTLRRHSCSWRSFSMESSKNDDVGGSNNNFVRRNTHVFTLLNLTISLGRNSSHSVSSSSMTKPSSGPTPTADVISAATEPGL